MRSAADRQRDEEERSGGRDVDGIKVFGDIDDQDNGHVTHTDTSRNDTSWKPKVDKEKAGFEALSWLKAVAIGVFIGVILVVFVLQRNNVYGTSMEPTLKDQDIVYVQKISTYLENYKRGQIVVLDGSNMEGYSHEEYLIKRIIGLPGDTLKFENGKVYLKKDGDNEFTQLNEPYLAPGTITTLSGVGIAKGYSEITLSADEYFCLGDNRIISNDSRMLGPFTEDRIKGVVLVRVYPFSKIGPVE